MTIVEYAERGLSVAPFYTIINGTCNCPAYMKDHDLCRPGKHPIVKKTATSKGGYHRATADVKQVKKWYSKWPNANIGLATGTDLIAIDPDSRHGGDIVLKELETELGPRPPTWSIQSGSGDVREVYRLPAGVALRSVNVQRDDKVLEFIAGPGVGLIIGGVHKSGNPYVDLGGEIAEFPKVWADYLLSLFPSPISINTHGKREERNGYSARGEDADPISLACAYWLWQRHCPADEFPELGEPWRCWTHDDEHPSATFLVKDRRVKLVCSAERKSYALADLYAREFGFDTLTKAQLALFDAKLRLDSGATPRVKVHYLPLDSSWRDNARQLYRWFIEVLECRAADGKTGAQPFTAAFASCLTGLPLITVQRVWTEIRKAGYVREEGTTPAGGYQAKLYTVQEPWRQLKARELLIEEGL